MSLPAVTAAPPQNCALHKRTVIRMPLAEMLSPGDGLVGVSGRMSCLWWRSAARTSECGGRFDVKYTPMLIFFFQC